jgi:hypothetical protein
MCLAAAGTVKHVACMAWSAGAASPLPIISCPGCSSHESWWGISINRYQLLTSIVRWILFLAAADMVEHVARMAWSAAQPFMHKPLLRVAIARPLGVITSIMNSLGAADRSFQVRSLTMTRQSSTRM